MTVNELKAELTRLGVSFNSAASKAELEALLQSNATTNVVDDELLKIIKDDQNAMEFGSEELQNALKEEREKEYPDFARDLDSNKTYFLLGFASVVDWKNSDNRTAHIRVAYVSEENGNTPLMVQFAAFAANQYEFVNFDGTKEKQNTPLPHFESTAARNAAVIELGKGYRFKVVHKRGHFNNPYTKRVFDRTHSWIIPVE